MDEITNLIKYDYNKLLDIDCGIQMVDGNFYCQNNKITTLKGSPKSVGSFFCYKNKITNLKGCPKYITDDFDCRYNILKTNVSNIKSVRFFLTTLKSFSFLFFDDFDFDIRLFFFAKSCNLSSSSESLQFIFKKDLIIFTIFFPSTKDLGSFIFLSNRFKISDIDLPAITLP